jgi:hypothetical protein
MVETVSGWHNTIARNRLDRQTRLQREAEEEERRRQAIDAEEKKYQKLKRQAQLAAAQTKAFAERPEIRGVNSQLLLLEVQEERDMQVLAKQQKKLAEAKKQIQFEEDYERKHREMWENEVRLRRAQREKAVLVAEEFKRQRDEKKARIAREKQDNINDEILIARQMDWELVKEQEAARQVRMRAQANSAENLRQNQVLESYKESMRAVEEEEDARIKRLRERILDEQDERKAADEKRKQDRLKARQALIDAEARRQMAEKREQEDFLERQLEQQHAKEAAHVAALTARRLSLREEREKEFRDGVAKQAHREKTKLEKLKHRQMFPFDGDDPENVLWAARDEARAKQKKDLQTFQVQQWREKKEKDAANREREKLEYNYAIAKDRDFLQRTQDYAAGLLVNIQDDSEENMRLCLMD